MGIDTLCLQPALGSSQFPKASLRRSSSQRRHCTTELEPNLLQSVCSTWTSAFRQERLAESLHAVFPCGIFETISPKQAVIWHAFFGTRTHGDMGLQILSTMRSEIPRHKSDLPCPVAISATRIESSVRRWIAKAHSKGLSRRVRSRCGR